MIYSNDIKEEKKKEEPVIVKEQAKIEIPKKDKKETFFPP